MTKHIFTTLFVGILFMSGILLGAENTLTGKPLNILLITADDMNYDALGVTGNKIRDITPHLDALANQGILFNRAFVTASVCQPSRQVLMTGRYPHNNGGTGFNPIRSDVPTLQESLEKAGYFKGIMAKVPHLAPIEKFHWDVIVKAEQLTAGRDPEKFHAYCTDFFKQAKESGKPFFLMANSQDPHRPFAGSEQETNARHANQTFPKVSRTIQPEEVEVPAFLPDIPDVRKEVAQYYTSVHRCDEAVGKILLALHESGFEENTLVMFLSDNGMAFPFAKTNVYRMSHQTPWIVRLPGVIQAGQIDETHFISGIDFTPTILEAIGLPQIDNTDGKSFVPILQGKKQPERDSVYTTFYQTSARQDFPMRAIRTERYGYLFSPWSDGELIFRNESQAGLTFNAMRQAAAENPEIAARVDLFLKRTLHEFYDYKDDPQALNNLVNNVSLKKELERRQQLLLQKMKESGDPLTHAFETFLQTGKPDMTGINTGAAGNANAARRNNRNNRNNTN
ncbi:MAG: sulfatase [Planctomycetaceae bacterium]|jgi:N-sulfoglucosamine sulfohydrolase|nr:sulfatase [Planctomycetaceae bacterium]